MGWIKAVAAGGAEAIKAFQRHKLGIEEAEAFRDAKNRSMAATTREIAEEDRDKEYMHSRALAIAAASGGGVDNPGVVKVLADLNAEGEYRIMSKLWSGQNEAEGLVFRAEAAEREADAALLAGAFNTVSSAMSAGAGGFGASAPSTGGAPTLPAPTPRTHV